MPRRTHNMHTPSAFCSQHFPVYPALVPRHAWYQEEEEEKDTCFLFSGTTCRSLHNASFPSLSRHSTTQSRQKQKRTPSSKKKRLPNAPEKVDPHTKKTTRSTKGAHKDTRVRKKRKKKTKHIIRQNPVSAKENISNHLFLWRQRSPGRLGAPQEGAWTSSQVACHCVRIVATPGTAHAPPEGPVPCDIP